LVAELWKNTKNYGMGLRNRDGDFMIDAAKHRFDAAE